MSRAGNRSKGRPGYVFDVLLTAGARLNLLMLNTSGVFEESQGRFILTWVEFYQSKREEGKKSTEWQLISRRLIR